MLGFEVTLVQLLYDLWIFFKDLFIKNGEIAMSLSGLGEFVSVCLSVGRTSSIFHPEPVPNGRVDGNDCDDMGQIQMAQERTKQGPGHEDSSSKRKKTMDL